VKWNTETGVYRVKEIGPRAGIGLASQQTR